MKKQVIAKLLVLCMVLAMLPVSAMAVNSTANEYSNNGHGARFGAARCGEIVNPCSCTGDNGSNDTWLPGTTTPGTGSNTENKPETPPAPEAAVEATVTEDTAAVAVEEKVLTDLVSEAVKTQSTTVVLKVEMPDGTNVTAVTTINVEVPASALLAIAEQANISLTLETPVANIQLASSVLAHLGEGAKSVGVTARFGAITRGQRSADETTGYEIALTKDGEAVNTVPGGIKTAVAAPSATAATVAYVIDANGVETIDAMSVVKNGNMTVNLPGSATFYLEDNAKSFSDVKGHWVATNGAVDFVSSHGLFNGVSDTEFAPDDTMTRAMMATVLHRMAGTPAAAGQSFADVPAGTWYTDAVAWAAENKVARGDPDGNFNPVNNVTRQEVAIFLYNFANALGLDTSISADLGNFSDSDSVNTWAIQAVAWANAAKILNGSDGELNAADDVTRAEAAAMLQRFCEYIAG